MDKTGTLKVVVGMPAYNEEKYIGSLVLQVRQYAHEVIVVDDGSTDRTSIIARLAGAAVIQHEKNRGYGAAIQRILAESAKLDPDVLVILDADSQHNPQEIPSLIRPISEGFDVVIGSRRIQKDNIPAYRNVGQKVLSRLTRVLSREKLSDTESGFRAYSKKAVTTLKPKEEGMAISAEIISEANARGLKLTEIPVSAIYTEDGSTLNPVMHGLGVLNRIIVMISERRPLLVFGATGSVSIILGIVAGVMVVQTLQTHQYLATGTALLSMLFITAGILSIFTGVILSVLVRRIKDAL
jgi:glycosyltransferase involved in cell wall biosynthesis